MDKTCATSGAGCFMCGNHGQGFRNRPGRGQRCAGGGKESMKGTFWGGSSDFIFGVFRWDELFHVDETIANTPGFGVLDLSAKEIGTWKGRKF